MHPIIGTLSVLPEGDNDAPLLCSLDAPNSLLHPPLRYPRRSWISIARKKSHLSIVCRVTRRDATRRARTESSGEKNLEKDECCTKEGPRRRKKKDLPVFLAASTSPAILRRPGTLARAALGVGRCCETCLLRYHLSSFISVGSVAPGRRSRDPAGPDHSRAHFRALHFPSRRYLDMR